MAEPVGEGDLMADEEILRQIQTLVAEEHGLRDAETPADRARITQLEETLDQCWDLLRQRRARREFGQDPAAVAARDPETVEHYEQ
jgi:DNA-binding transcriptional regulator PaaX